MRAGVFVALVAALGVGAQFHSGSNCTASSSSGVLEHARDTTTRAFAKAFVDACGASSVDSLMATSFQQMSSVARAVTEVRLQSVVSCVSQGYNLACATATATADSTAKTLARMVSTAVASAYTNCAMCSPSQGVRTARALFNSTLQLTAHSAAMAKASVCVGPNSSASAAALVNCTSQIYAHGLAYALATVMVEKGCTNVTTTAVATVESMVSADPMCGCSGYTYTCAADGSGCAVKKTATNLTAAFVGFASVPTVSAMLTSECKAYDTQLGGLHG